MTVAATFKIVDIVALFSLDLVPPLLHVALALRYRCCLPLSSLPLLLPLIVVAAAAALDTFSHLSPDHIEESRTPTPLTFCN